MKWQQTFRADPACAALADRHYSRRAVGSLQFAPPGRCVVLYSRTASGRAYWVTSWQRPEFVKHAWPDAWICSAFRNEGAGLSSELITQALAATRYAFGDPPAGLSMVTFVDPTKTKPKRHPGFCFLMAGFKKVGKTKGGLIALGIDRELMPAAEAPKHTQASLL